MVISIVYVPVLIFTSLPYLNTNSFVFLKNNIPDFESKIRAISIPRFGANALGSNPSGDRIFYAFIKE